MNANFFSIMIPFSLISAFDRDDKWRWIQFLSFDDNKSNEIVGYSTIHQINISLDNIRNHNDKWNFIDQSCHVELSKNFLYEIDKPKKLWKSINEKFFSQECSSFLVISGSLYWFIAPGKFFQLKKIDDRMSHRNELPEFFSKNSEKILRDENNSNPMRSFRLQWVNLKSN